MRSRSLLRVETRIVLMQHVRLRAFVFHISHPFRDLCCQISHPFSHPFRDLSHPFSHPFRDLYLAPVPRPLLPNAGHHHLTRFNNLAHGIIISNTAHISTLHAREFAMTRQ
jgi:hypothetical protein